MFCEDVCLGKTRGIDKLRVFNDALNAKVVEQVNGSQELVMLTSFALESNDYHLKKALQDRISEVASWRWVLEDLSKRLDESIVSLKYEHNAVRVVVQRVQEEIDCHSREGSRPGAICPLTDLVEEAVIQEYQFLRDQKKNFESLILELDKQTALLEKTKKKIVLDVLNKQQALVVDETCASRDYSDAVIEEWKTKKKGSPVKRWVRRCLALKRSGLKALSNAIITRQQIRGARVRLSISAQSFAAKIDTVLRRRLHTNKLKLQDLNWQREEAVRDYNSLQEELSLAEKAVVEIMDQERIVAARLADRNQRPHRELTKDGVNRKLRDEQNQLRRFAKDLRHDVEELIVLQNRLTKAIAHIDCCAEDILQVIGLDEERIRCRQGEASQRESSDANTLNNNTMSQPHHNKIAVGPSRAHVQSSEQLTVIQEINEDAEDDYPFDF